MFDVIDNSFYLFWFWILKNVAQIYRYTNNIGTQNHLYFSTLKKQINILVTSLNT